MIDFDYINKTLARFEGNGYTRGYIPCKGGTYFGAEDKGEPLGASGVTIATGVDLGQQTKDGLESMGISIETLAVINPYIGKKRLDAVQQLKKTPLTITEAQVTEIDNAVHTRYINETADMFGREKFEATYKQVQAVAVSLHYQFGTPSRAESPGLYGAWTSMRTEKYKAAAEYLYAEGYWSANHRQYMARRRQEAAMLREIA